MTKEGGGARSGADQMWRRSISYPPPSFGHPRCRAAPTFLRLHRDPKPAPATLVLGALTAHPCWRRPAGAARPLMPAPPRPARRRPPPLSPAPVPACSENPDYNLLTDANLSYSMRYAPSLPPSNNHHNDGQQQQFGGPPPGHPAHLGGGPPNGGLGVSAPHMLHMHGGPMGPGPRGNGGNGVPPGGGATITMAVPEDKVGVVIGKQVRSGGTEARQGGREGGNSSRAAGADARSRQFRGCLNTRSLPSLALLTLPCSPPVCPLAAPCRRAL